VDFLLILLLVASGLLLHWAFVVPALRRHRLAKMRLETEEIVTERLLEDAEKQLKRFALIEFSWVGVESDLVDPSLKTCILDARRTINAIKLRELRLNIPLSQPEKNVWRHINRGW
jgi:hypothetical protein